MGDSNFHCYIFILGKKFQSGTCVNLVQFSVMQYFCMEREVAEIMGEWKMQPVFTRRFKCRSLQASNLRKWLMLKVAINQFLVEL